MKYLLKYNKNLSLWIKHILLFWMTSTLPLKCLRAHSRLPISPSSFDLGFKKCQQKPISRVSFFEQRKLAKSTSIKILWNPRLSPPSILKWFATKLMLRMYAFWINRLLYQYNFLVHTHSNWAKIAGQFDYEVYLSFLYEWYWIHWALFILFLKPYINFLKITVSSKHGYMNTQIHSIHKSH